MKRYIIYAGFTSNSHLSSLDLWQISNLSQIARKTNSKLVFSFAQLFRGESEFQSSSEYDLLLRPNQGYDFGSWLQAIGLYKFNADDKLLLLNSSLVGPLNFKETFWEKMFDHKSDFVALTESKEILNHAQSFTWRINGRIANDKRFTNFLEQSYSINDRADAIEKMELKLNTTIRKMGYTTHAIFPAGTVCYTSQNPSLAGWEKLLKSGFPFFKKKLLVDLGPKVIIDFLEFHQILDQQINFQHFAQVIQREIEK